MTGWRGFKRTTGLRSREVTTDGFNVMSDGFVRSDKCLALLERLLILQSLASPRRRLILKIFLWLGH